MNSLKMALQKAGHRKSCILFDYDSTIARVPVDWPRARVSYRVYLAEIFPELVIPETARVDEMEAMALRHAPDAIGQVFSFREELERALDGWHEPLTDTCEFIQHLIRQSDHRLFIVSNNLRRTIEIGLKQLGLSDAFEAILGVDDVGVPKPETRAFTLLQESYGLSPKNCIFIGDNDRTDGGFCRALDIFFINIKEK